MSAVAPDNPLTADEHRATMAAYVAEGERRARALGNRGPLRLDAGGRVASDILDAYWQHGFYVFETVIGDDELAVLRAEVDAMLASAPPAPDAGREARGLAGSRYRFARPSYRFARPLSDMLGGTAFNKGRHPVKMADAAPAAGAPAWTVERLLANLQTMDSCLRLYGHAGLLAMAEAVNGPDFVPYNEVAFIKEPGLGPAVSWHQDGTTHWDAPDWDAGAHGFNFMAQLYPSTAGNGVWFVPGSHRLGKADIPAMVEPSGTERIAGAVPLLAAAGDVCIANRQCVHGSFPNSSAARRVTLNAGFFPRRRVEGVAATHLDGTEEVYDATRIDERCRLIPIAIDARAQAFSHERRFVYQPLAGAGADHRWHESNRRAVVNDYNLRDLYI